MMECGEFLTRMTEELQTVINIETTKRM